jgi:hypothetical protein
MTDRQPRQRKTSRQRAEESLGVAQRKHDRLVKEVAVRRAELAAAESELAEAKRRLEYARQDPALDPQQLDTPHIPTGDAA